MKKTLTFLIFIPLGIFAQTSEFHYTYDDSGNRIVRAHVELKPNQPQGEHTSAIAYEDAIAGLQVSLYPNPTQDEVIIEAKGGELFAEHVRIIDNRGALLLHLQKQNMPLHLYFGKYPRGTYTVNIQVGNEVKNYKILVTK